MPIQRKSFIQVSKFQWGTNIHSESWVESLVELLVELWVEHKHENMAATSEIGGGFVLPLGSCLDHVGCTA